MSLEFRWKEKKNATDPEEEKVEQLIENSSGSRDVLIKRKLQRLVKLKHIEAVEDKFGSLKFVPNDDKDFKKVQRENDIFSKKEKSHAGSISSKREKQIVSLIKLGYPIAETSRRAHSTTTQVHQVINKFGLVPQSRYKFVLVPVCKSKPKFYFTAKGGINILFGRPGGTKINNSVCQKNGFRLVKAQILWYEMPNRSVYYIPTKKRFFIKDGEDSYARCIYNFDFKYN